MTRSAWKIAATTALFLPVFFLSSCGDDVAGPTEWGREGSDESDWMALALSGQIDAPEAMSARIANDLDEIRSSLQSMIPGVKEVRYAPPWQPNRVRLEVTEALFDAITQGDTSAFAEINVEWNASVYHTSHLWQFDGRRPYVVILDFAGNYHPARIAERYSEIDSVLDAEALPNVMRSAPVLRNVYANSSEDSFEYLVRESTRHETAYTYSRISRFEDRFDYVRCGDGGCEYVGSYTPGATDEPNWWEKARQSLETGSDWSSLVLNRDAN